MASYIFLHSKGLVHAAKKCSANQLSILWSDDKSHDSDPRLWTPNYHPKPIIYFATVNVFASTSINVSLHITFYTTLRFLLPYYIYKEKLWHLYSLASLDVLYFLLFIFTWEKIRGQLILCFIMLLLLYNFSTNQPHKEVLERIF